MNLTQYPALAQVLSAQSPETVLAWRWTDDILPSQADPHWKGDGIYGEGTYLRPTKEEPLLPYLKTPRAWRGAKSLLPSYRNDPEFAAHWRLYTEYEISFKNIAHLSETNTEQLWSSDFIGTKDNPLKVGKFDCWDVEDLLKKKGFDGMIVLGANVDGGQQVFIPAGKKPVAKTLRYHLFLREQPLAEQIGKKIRSTPQKIRNGWYVSFNAGQAPAVETILKTKLAPPIKQNSALAQILTAQTRMDDLEDAWGVFLLKTGLDLEAEDDPDSPTMKKTRAAWARSVLSAKIEQVPVADALNWDIMDHGRRPEKEHTKNPIVVGKSGNEFHVLDGAHRVLHANEQGQETIPALMLNLDWADLDLFE